EVIAVVVPLEIVTRVKPSVAPCAGSCFRVFVILGHHRPRLCRTNEKLANSARRNLTVVVVNDKELDLLGSTLAASCGDSRICCGDDWHVRLRHVEASEYVNAKST